MLLGRVTVTSHLGVTLSELSKGEGVFGISDEEDGA